MKRSHRAPAKPNNHSSGIVTGRPERGVGLIPTAKETRSRRKDSVVIYEEGDLRGAVAEALARSAEPYRALSEMGVIKNAAEFFYDGGD